MAPPRRRKKAGEASKGAKTVSVSPLRLESTPKGGEYEVNEVVASETLGLYEDKRPGRRVQEPHSPPSPRAWQQRTLPRRDRISLSWRKVFLALAVARGISAWLNIIHDCDETFNYWEPLHYLDRGSGLQTWEYSAENALRSYLYLVIHLVLIKPISWWACDGPSKVLSFYWMRGLFAFASAATDASLVTAVSSLCGNSAGLQSLLILLFSAGTFVSSTSFLPSTFTMYFISASVAAMWMKRPCLSVALAAVGVLVGWPFAVLAGAPLVLYALFTGGFWKVVGTGAASSAFIMALSVLADRYFYGRWTVSVFNLVAYNVAGGGDSHLYGVEGPFYYLRNCFNNFNLALPLALCLPFAMLVAKRRSIENWLLVSVGVSPLYIWMGFMSSVAHKEERFMYVVYPLIAVAAGITLSIIFNVAWWNHVMRTASWTMSILAKVVTATKLLILVAMVVLSLSRTCALLRNYSASMRIYHTMPMVLPEATPPSPPPSRFSTLGPLWPSTATKTTVEPEGVVVVCIGSEWHRYPSSYFLPASNYTLAFLDDGFRGLLPFPFRSEAGGTASAPNYFNKRNQAAAGQFLKNEERCDFLVELVLDSSVGGRRGRSDDSARWEIISDLPFVDGQRSPPLFRAFYIPWISESKNVYGSYRLAKTRRNAKKQKSLTW